jgi:putative transposase
MPRPSDRRERTARRHNSLRLASHDYGQPGAYFITVCSAGRACLFGRVADDTMILNAAGRVVRRCWLEIPAHSRGVALDVFVVMPSHVHGIVWLARARHASPLRVVVGSFKAAVSRTIGLRIWQRSFHDRVIRNDEELEALRRYVVENPLRWALDRENPDRRALS